MRFLALLVLTGCIPEATSTNEQALTGREGIDAEEPDDRPIVRIMPLGDSITAQHGSYSGSAPSARSASTRPNTKAIASISS
jgi:hypothetical protein